MLKRTLWLVPALVAALVLGGASEAQSECKKGKKGGPAGFEKRGGPKDGARGFGGAYGFGGANKADGFNMNFRKALRTTYGTFTLTGDWAYVRHFKLRSPGSAPQDPAPERPAAVELLVEPHVEVQGVVVT